MRGVHTISQIIDPAEVLGILLRNSCCSIPQAGGEKQGHYMNLTNASAASIGNICYDLQLLAESPKEVISRLSNISETISCSDNPLYADRCYQTRMSRSSPSEFTMQSLGWPQRIEVRLLEFLPCSYEETCRGSCQ